LAAATPFGAIPVTLGSYNLNAAATDVVTATGLNINSEYLVSVALVGTVMSAPTLGTFVGCSSVSASTGNNAGATTATYFYTIKATANSISFVCNITATTVTSSSLVLAALTPIPSF
jgi:hypothetical protein